MRRVITYGTFDLLHYGHISLLKRAKALGDYLVVGVTSEQYDRERGKLNVRQTLAERMEGIRRSGLADKIVVEEYEGQKIRDIAENQIDVFAIGSDWEGQFDYLREYCEVVYLERTKGVSSTELRQGADGVLRLGIIGSGRIASRFVRESKYVSGINVEGVYNPHVDSARRFAETHQLAFYTDDLNRFFESVKAVYVAAPHNFHYQYIMAVLEHGCHVLCEKPMVLTRGEAVSAFALAKRNGLVLQEAIKTAYCPAFSHLVVLAKSGRIGVIRDVEAVFTKLIDDPGSRELNPAMAGGSMNELASYVLLPILKLLGSGVREMRFWSVMEGGVDTFTRGLFRYDSATASFKVGLGTKSEGDLVITGTRGYIYVPAPWWKTEYFEMRFEDMRDNRKYFYKFDGDGLRYELTEFVRRIADGGRESAMLSAEDSVRLAEWLGAWHRPDGYETGRHGSLCEVVYLERTPETSTTRIKENLGKRHEGE